MCYLSLPWETKVIDPDKVPPDQDVGLFCMCHLKNKKTADMLLLASLVFIFCMRTNCHKTTQNVT